jgi:hypothetical protein
MEWPLMAYPDQLVEGAYDYELGWCFVLKPWLALKVETFRLTSLPSACAPGVILTWRILLL